MTKEYYFHGTTTDDFRFTVCGLVDDATPDTIVLGISVTSATDNFVKKDGRARAYKRATEAFGEKGNCTRSLTAFNMYMPGKPYPDWSRHAFGTLIIKWLVSPKKTLLKDFGLYH